MSFFRLKHGYWETTKEDTAFAIAELTYKYGTPNCISFYDLQLTHLPSDIFKCYFLDTLDLGGNKLNYLSPEIGNLNNLEWLNLSGNNLKSLPKSISKMKALKTICLCNNPLVDLPTELLNLTDLEIEIEKNKIHLLPEKLRKSAFPPEKYTYSWDL